jgi:hypothetical protein
MPAAVPPPVTGPGVIGPPPVTAPAPVTGPPGLTGPPGMTGPPGTPRSRRKRLWLAMALGIMALLCLGGVGVVVSLYDGATEIKRSAPDAVVDNFLRAYLVNRDDTQAALYQCKSNGNFAELKALRADIVSREKQYTLGIRVSWTTLTISTRDGQTTVSTEIRRAITDGSERTSDAWRFSMVDQDGWRVCGATKLS